MLVGLNAKSGLNCKKPITYLSNQGRWLENLRAGAAQIRSTDRQAKYALLVSADLPGLQAEMIDWILREGQPRTEDAVVSMVPRQAMHDRLPEVKFGWVRFAEGAFRASGLTICRLDLLLDEQDEQWVKFVQGRDHPAGLAGNLGLGTYMRYLFGRLSLEQASERVKTEFGLHARLLPCPYVEVGLPVNDPQMLDCLEAELKKRTKKATALPSKGKPGSLAAPIVKKAAGQGGAAPAARGKARKKPVAKG